MPQSMFRRFASLCGVPHFSHAVIAKSWNLGPDTGPHADQALAQRKQACTALGLDFHRLSRPQQVHGVKVARVEAGIAGAGRHGVQTPIAGCDGVMTDVPGVPLIAFSADCCLLLVIDPKVHAAGLTHAGWRGVAGGAADVLVERMQDAYGARPARMLAAIGPAAQPCCYEVSGDLARELADSPHCGPAVLSTRRGKWYLDMQAALVRQLGRCGLTVDRIERMQDCTICDERFYSYRREGAATGRNAILAGWAE
jgi:YfiH family protein